MLLHLKLQMQSRRLAKHPESSDTWIMNYSERPLFAQSVRRPKRKTSSGAQRAFDRNLQVLPFGARSECHISLSLLCAYRAARPYAHMHTRLGRSQNFLGIQNLFPRAFRELWPESPSSARPKLKTGQRAWQSEGRL